MLIIELTGDVAPASVPGGAVFELAASLGISSHRARRLRVMVDELVVVAQQREHGDRPPEVKVRAWTDQGFLRVEVTDLGIPAFEDDVVVPHELVRLGFAESIDLQAGGRDGNISRCSLIISEDDAREHLRASESVLQHDEPEVDQSVALVVRKMKSSECGDLARLVYRCYGYNYPSEDIYFPDRMAAVIDQGLMHSSVVENEDGELVGHASLTLANADSRIAEAGKLVVDPRYRSHGLAKQLANLRRKSADELKLVGLWSECVSNHPFSQRNQIKLGAHETGIFFGLMPSTVKMTGISSDDDVRGSLVAMYLPLPGSSARKLYCPPRYAPVVREIVEHLDLEREVADLGEVSSPSSHMEVSVDQAANVSVITVENVGEDLLPQLEGRLEDLKCMRIAAVYLDLPLDDAGTADVGEHMAGLGFFFSALLPESGPRGDMLRLQLLNHQKMHPDHIKVASEWGGRLLQYCVEDQSKVRDHIRKLRISD
jgi:N-acetylglutamate synthase-like GNAT family acetyltransferase